MEFGPVNELRAYKGSSTTANLTPNLNFLPRRSRGEGGPAPP